MAAREPMTRPCNWCGAELLWSPNAETGTLLALNPDPVGEPAAGLVAVNPRTGLCRPLGPLDLYVAHRWRRQGVAFHREHFPCAASPMGRGRTS